MRAWAALLPANGSQTNGRMEAWMSKRDREAAEDLRKHAELDHQMIRDHDEGLHVHGEDFIDMVRRKTKELWRAVKAFEDRAGRGSQSP